MGAETTLNFENLFPSSIVVSPNFFLSKLFTFGSYSQSLNYVYRRMNQRNQSLKLYLILMFYLQIFTLKLYFSLTLMPSLHCKKNPSTRVQSTSLNQKLNDKINGIDLTCIYVVFVYIYKLTWGDCTDSTSP